MIDISKLSQQYSVRVLRPNDVDEILAICKSNNLFYKYTNANPTKENIIEDMNITPPNVNICDKYYVGFYQEDHLVAILDLIDGWPDEKIAYIGFFMMNLGFQGKNIGSSIIKDIISYLKQIGKTKVRLAIDKGNPQSYHFWRKNGFKVIYEKDLDGWTKMVAELAL